jgi:dTDP-glucose 4,6-dehydratase
VRALGVKRYLQISTDEVYGSTESGSFTEKSDLDPSSPYSASKAGGDLLVLAYHRTFGTPVLITRSSNNYGPYQYPEKIVPLFITNAIDGEALPMYGDGLNVRDWLYVDDNCAAIEMVLLRGAAGEVYNIGGGNEIKNLTLTRQILKLLGKSPSLIRFVSDRPGHDRRYAIDCAKVRALGWRPTTTFETGLERTVAWYRDHPEWWRKLKSGEWREYYAQQYRELG